MEDNTVRSSKGNEVYKHQEVQQEDKIMETEVGEKISKESERRIRDDLEENSQEVIAPR